MSTIRKSLKRLVDVTGIEPVTPCLQSVYGVRATSAHELLQAAIGQCLCGLRSHPLMLRIAS